MSIVSAQTTMKMTGYWYMLFSFMMLFFPDKLLDSYNVEGPATTSPYAKFMMFGMGCQFFSACCAPMIAARLEDDKVYSHVAGSQAVSAAINIFYNLGFGTAAAKAAGLPLEGIYFNTAAAAILGFLNFQVWQECGAEKPSFLGFGQNAMVNCLRANMVCGLVFAVGLFFGGDAMVAQYMPGMPDDVAPFIKMMMPGMAIMLFSNTMANGAMIISGNDEARYAAVRAGAFFWAMQAGSLSGQKLINGMIGNEKANESYWFNVAMCFGFFYYNTQTLVAADKAKQD